MKRFFALLSSALFIASCDMPTEKTPEKTSLPVAGTWKLVSGTIIEKGDTTITDYTKGKEFIKIINGTHFAFLQHDLQKGKDSSASFSAGGGTYTLKDSTYTEHLQYCNAREWEGHHFPFTVTISADTLVQQGVEKIPDAGIERLNIEKYVRMQ